MNAPIRALLTLLAAAATGALLWVAAQLDTQSTDGYYAAHGLIVLGGLLLGLVQFRATATRRPWLPMLLVAPAAFAALWLIAAADPVSNTFRDHLRAWSSDLGIAGAVSDIGHWHGVLALGAGLLIGLTAAPALLARRRQEVAAPATPAPVPVAAPAARGTDEHVFVEQNEHDPVAQPDSAPESPAVSPAAAETGEASEERTPAAHA